MSKPQQRWLNWKKHLAITSKIARFQPLSFLKAGLLLPLILLVAWAGSASAQGFSEPKTRILFIFDASNSMNGQWQNGSKMKIASRLLTETLDSLRNVPELELALRVYGHQKNYLMGQDCEDTELVVPFAEHNGPAIAKALTTIRAQGTTPIAHTLEKTGNDFPRCPECRHIIILITDGIEECDGDPCAVSAALQSRNIIVKPFVIGIGLDPNFAKTFSCIGNYYDATNEETFRDVLNIVVSQALNSTTAQINLLDINNKPTETNVPLTMYNAKSGSVVENWVHTMNHAGNPDTVSIDPIGMYNMVVHTIPPVRVDSITLTPGKHNIIAAKTPQGQLELKTSKGGFDRDLQAIVRQSGSTRTLHVQDFVGQESYLVGKYDLEILSLPRRYFKEVDISQSHTTTVTLPSPGNVTIYTGSEGYGSILERTNGALEWVCDLKQRTNQNTQKFRLQPGRYVVVFRRKASKETIFTNTQEFTVQPGSSTTVNLRQK